MNPKLCKRLILAGSSPAVSPSPPDQKGSSFSKTTLRDEATLLLSIADICKSEIRADGLSAVFSDGDGESSADDEESSSFPKFPRLDCAGKPPMMQLLAPRTESIYDILGAASSNTNAFKEDMYPRARCVSMDAMEHDVGPVAATVVERATSPLLPLAAEDQAQSDPLSPAHLVSPTPTSPAFRRLPLRKQGLRLSHKAIKEHHSHAQHSDSDESSSASPEVRVSCATDKKSKPLQGSCAKGIPIKKILRKKFSWKNYPELEQYLIANREEYLRHSALNYTVQQKQYNNRLTERLLELATEHGYVFNPDEFSFVTVRDRIRCYYKSFVQSAKKRGILMGYAARKAGLLTEDDLEKSSGRAGLIVTP